MSVPSFLADCAPWSASRWTRDLIHRSAQASVVRTGGMAPPGDTHPSPIHASTPTGVSFPASATTRHPMSCRGEPCSTCSAKPSADSFKSRLTW